MPEELFAKIRKTIPVAWKICFASAMIVGLITHIYKITNWLPNWDSLVFRYDPQNMVAMGRWFLPVVCGLSSFYDLPWVGGLLALLWHGLGAVCICKMFRVSKNVTAVLIGAAVITFPTVTSVLMYNYVADGYAIAFFLSCMAAAFLVGEKTNYIGSIVCIAFSAGIYQAYITVTIMLILCHLVLEAMREETQAVQLIVKSLKFLAAGALGMALYYLLMTVMLKVTDTALLEYQGLNSALTFTGVKIHGVLYTIKQSCVTYFFDFSNGITVFGVLNGLIFVSTVALYLADAIQYRISIAKLLMVAVYVICLPIGANILAFINSEVDYHNLMKMGFFVFYLFLILQYERLEYRFPKWNVTKAWVIFGLAVLFVMNNSIIANVSYHKLHMAYEKSYGTLIRIADRIEQTEDASECDRILVIGALEGSEAYSVNLPPDMTGVTDSYILRADDEIVRQSVLCSALNDYCGTDYTFLAGEEKKALMGKVGAEEMGIWPADDSIRVSDGVIVIRLGSEVQ